MIDIDESALTVREARRGGNVAADLRSLLGSGPEVYPVVDLSAKWGVEPQQVSLLGLAEIPADVRKALSREIKQYEASRRSRIALEDEAHEAAEANARAHAAYDAAVREMVADDATAVPTGGSRLPRRPDDTAHATVQEILAGKIVAARQREAAALADLQPKLQDALLPHALMHAASSYLATVSEMRATAEALAKLIADAQSGRYRLITLRERQVRREVERQSGKPMLDIEPAILLGERGLETRLGNLAMGNGMVPIMNAAADLDRERTEVLCKPVTLVDMEGPAQLRVMDRFSPDEWATAEILPAITSD